MWVDRTLLSERVRLSREWVMRPLWWSHPVERRASTGSKALMQEPLGISKDWCGDLVAGAGGAG